MSKIIIRIYVLIILECRVSLEEASEIFQIEVNLLKQMIAESQINLEYQKALEYLYYETSVYEGENKKGKLKAMTYYRRLRRILGIKNREEKIELLNAFIVALSGPDIKSLIGKSYIYNEDDKNKVFKYRIKYAKTSKEIEEEINISHQLLKEWESRLPCCETKARLEILRTYLDNRYSGIRPR